MRSAGGFRSDIQALRALSVVAVVLYHAGFPVRGGYLGVDVFFVVSGFLVSGILLREFEKTGSIKLRGFYRRRFLRLAPTFMVVVLTTIFFLYFVVGPVANPDDAALTAIGATLLSANVVTAFTNSDYFNEAENALLHLWSLGVEEQFYLVFPILLLAIARFSIFARRNYTAAETIFWLLVVASFALALVPEQEVFDSTWAKMLLGFYSPVIRVWEFGIGILAMFISRRFQFSGPARVGISITGLALIIVSFFVVASSSDVPGVSTLIPTVGAALVLCAGAPWLTWSPLMWLGRCSYSLYLWHWPVIFIFMIIWPANTYNAAFAVLVAVVLSAISERYFERPYMRLDGESEITGIHRKYFWVVATLMVLGASYIFGPRFWGMLEEAEILKPNAGEIGSAEYYQEIDALFFPCTNRVFLELAPARYGYTICFQSKPQGRPSVLLVGDSHADHLLAGLASELPSENVGSVVTNGFRDRVFDSPRFDRVLQELEMDKTLKVVILAAFWGDPDRSPSTMFSLAELDHVKTRLELSGKRVLVAADVNHFSYHPSLCKYPKTLFSQAPKVCEDDEIRSKRTSGVVNWAARNDVGVIDTRSNLCNDGRCSMLSSEGALLYRDFHHLTVEGSRVALKDQLKIVLDSVNE